jgi:hypothetical protein
LLTASSAIKLFVLKKNKKTKKTHCFNKNMHGLHTSETYVLGGMFLSPLKVATTH